MESKVFQEFRISGGAAWFEQLWACPPAVLAVSEALNMLSCPWSLGQWHWRLPRISGLLIEAQELGLD